MKKKLYNFYMDILVKRINKLLKENHITMYRLAKDLEVSHTAVMKWCAGTNEPKASYIRAIALYFDVSTDYLLGIENENGTKTYNNYGTHNGNVNF